MKYKDIYDIAVPQYKREMEKWNLFAGHIGRPISVFITMPLVNTKVRPTMVTLWSVIAVLIGACLLSFGSELWVLIVGWCFLFLWNLLDGVDGNLARCQGTCSARGELWDAFGGYTALVLTYIAVSIASYNDILDLYILEKHWVLILGGLTASLSIFPRLILHKKLNLGIDKNVTNQLKDKSKFGFKQIVSMNLVSATGLMQPFILICIITHTLSLFVIIYFVVNLFIAIVSLWKLLK